ncbi:MAG: TfoX/Sxy family protein [Gammaproteobacteria bacterium]|nr:TfoX/Sxy family protein [Gammaproteobacteria bacterium]
MATSQSTIDYLLDQLSDLSDVTAKKMFGEYCVYLAGKPVGLVCDEQLYLKPTNAARAMISDVAEESPYPNAKPHILVTADLWEDGEWLAELIQATAGELPAPKLKPKKGKVPGRHD